VPTTIHELGVERYTCSHGCSTLRPTDGITCVGWDAISHDGTKVAPAIGGSLPSDWMLLDVATRSQIVLRDRSGFGTETTTNPDGPRTVNMYRGDLTFGGATFLPSADGS